MKVIEFERLGRYRLLDKIGHGTYGTVYRCQPEEGQTSQYLAIKSIPITEIGLPSLLEASIMATTDSPGLSSALAITAETYNLYILSELGTSDLSQWTHHTKENYRPTEEQLRRWTFQLLCGLVCLERQNLVHGDIKPSNILLYADDNVRLTDFTLATLAGLPIERTLYTYPYRPPEIWALGQLSLPWGLKEPRVETLSSSTDSQPSSEESTPMPLEIRSNIRSDVWALGCTLYEIATGHYLFPVFSRSTSKAEIRRRLIEAIQAWDQGGPTQEYWRKIPSNFAELLLQMLRVPIELRPSPIDLIQSPYFTGLTPETYTWIRSPVQRPITVEEYTRTYRWCDAQSGRIDPRYRNQLIDQAIDLYLRTVKMGLPATSRLAACFHIAQKMVMPFHDPLYPEGEVGKLLTHERQICLYLDYRLHRDARSQELSSRVDLTGNVRPSFTGMLARKS